MPEPTDAQADLWMVQGPEGVLKQLRHAFEEKGIEQVGQVAPDIVVLRMTASCAEQLKTEFRELTIEANPALR